MRMRDTGVKQEGSNPWPAGWVGGGQVEQLVERAAQTERSQQGAAPLGVFAG